ncbi:hypothetical protein BYT27DRAFT_7263908 [Phlegmacium glaucopus]|nr:hypothetical protein BYT27DRAFT_7263908 [Phlegmacium glaucopus]
MNQTDAMRPDQALLTFAGIFLHFQKHPKPSIAAGIKKQIEKLWKALNQPMFVLALIINPFEELSRFGDKASISPFTLNTVLLEGDNPVTVWRNFLTMPSTAELADFAILLLGMSVGADICALQKDAGYIQERTKRQNHDDSKVGGLLAVPRFADLLEADEALSEVEGEPSVPQPALVRT